MKPTPPFQLWNDAVEMTGFGRRAAATDGARCLKRLREEMGDKFDSAFRLRMLTARADSFEDLLENWAHERVRLGK